MAASIGDNPDRSQAAEQSVFFPDEFGGEPDLFHARWRDGVLIVDLNRHGSAVMWIGFVCTPWLLIHAMLWILRRQIAQQGAQGMSLTYDQLWWVLHGFAGFMMVMMLGMLLWKISIWKKRSAIALFDPGSGVVRDIRRGLEWPISRVEGFRFVCGSVTRGPWHNTSTYPVQQWRIVDRSDAEAMREHVLLTEFDWGFRFTRTVRKFAKATGKPLEIPRLGRARRLTGEQAAQLFPQPRDLYQLMRGPTR